MYVHFEMVPARFPAELRELLHRFPAGSLRLELGIQTFNSNTAALIGRLSHSGRNGSDPDKELETLNFLHRETNAIVHADLIAGLPGEDMASFGKGFDRLWQAQPTEIQLGILKLLPGTPIIRHTKTYEMVYAPEPPYEVLETAALPAADLDRIKNFARFWELIVNRGVFPDLVPRLFPGGEPVFDRFMALSDMLLARFGRNWGIDRSELRSCLYIY
jgi:coproporphyrinogen III oxidase-like Fe-S oxidoreductase